MAVTLKIDGMHCGGCVKSVEKALNSIEGVDHIAVDLDSGTAKVDVPEGFDVAKLKAAVEDAGYDVEIAA